MAAHVDITDHKSHTVTPNTGAARGVDGPKGARLCHIYAPADAVVVVQVGPDVTDGTTDIAPASPSSGDASGMPIPTGVWLALPVSPDDCPQTAGLRRPTVYFQGDAAIHVRFSGGGIG